MSNRHNLNEPSSSTLMHQEETESTLLHDMSIDSSDDMRYHQSLWLTPLDCADLLSSICVGTPEITKINGRTSVIVALPFGQMTIQSEVGLWEEIVASNQLVCLIEVAHLMFNDAAGLQSLNEQLQWSTASMTNSVLSFKRIVSLAGDSATDRSMLTEISEFYTEIEAVWLKLSSITDCSVN